MALFRDLGVHRRARLRGALKYDSTQALDFLLLSKASPPLPEGREACQQGEAAPPTGPLPAATAALGGLRRGVVVIRGERTVTVVVSAVVISPRVVVPDIVVVVATRVVVP